MKFIMFSKMLQGFNISELADAIIDLGLSGVDLTVRSGGHIDPERVRRDLPEAISVIRGKGLDVPMLTTAITSASDPTAGEIFETAAAQGVKYIKLGYWLHKSFGSVGKSIEEMQRDLDGLEELASKVGTKLGLHTHSGNYLTADPGIIWCLLRDRDPSVMGAYLDAGHMFTEGGYGVWRMGLDLLSDRLFMVAIKDLMWVEQPEAGSKGRYPKVVPMGSGFVDWRAFFKHLDDLKFTGPISIHSEYDGMSSPEIVKQTAKDLEFLRGFITI